MVHKKFLSTQQLLQQCSIRISSRAKYLRLSVSLGKGIVVVVPKSMKKHQLAKLIPEFVQEKQLWLNQTIVKLQEQQQEKSLLEPCQLPEQINLCAIGQVFSIDYCHVSTPLKITHHESYHLSICGDLSKRKKIFALLEAFFKKYARLYLQQRLDQLSLAANLDYQRLTVRAQRTRWGSCSARKNINLNYRLLFIETRLLDYILLHELVHTVHMNHSKNFWSLLVSLMPDARERDKQVNQVARNLPCWIFHSK